MMFLFKSGQNILYNCPDAYILDQKDKRIEWGAELIICPVYSKGSNVMYGTQTICAMFTHEGSQSSQGDIYWLPDTNNTYITSWLNLIENSHDVKMVDTDRVVMFDLGPRHPRYFRSKNDLCWYLSNIYPLDIVHISDEYN